MMMLTMMMYLQDEDDGEGDDSHEDHKQTIRP